MVALISENPGESMRLARAQAQACADSDHRLRQCAACEGEGGRLVAYLQHGDWGGPYRTERVDVKESPAPMSGRTASGYGKRLPTSYLIRIDRQWLRVKAVCFSNAATLYVTSRGVDIVCQIERS